MARFTLPRDLYHGKGSLEVLKTLTGKKAVICVGGGYRKPKIIFMKPVWRLSLLRESSQIRPLKLL